jgi:predicted outer membrane repeat protein
MEEIIVTEPTAFSSAVSTANESTDKTKITVSENVEEIVIAEELMITSSIVFQGHDDLTLKGDGDNRLFFIQSNFDEDNLITVKFRDFAMTSGFATRRDDYLPSDADLANPSAARGGAIATHGPLNVRIKNVSFEDNTARQGGGAIYLGWLSDAVIKDSYFMDNDGSYANDERGAGAISANNSDLTIRSSEFVGNTGINGGAINGLQTSLLITNSEFTGNKTESYPDPESLRPNLRGYGGVVYVDLPAPPNRDDGYLIIKNSSFSDNQAESAGGAVYHWTTSNDMVKIKQSLFDGNQVTGSPSEAGNGGAIDLQSGGAAEDRDALLFNNDFLDNEAIAQGGAIRVRNYDTISKNNDFIGNEAGLGGAFSYQSEEESDLLINYNLFEENQAERAGAINGYNAVDNITIKNTSFLNNQATNTQGEAIHTDATFFGLNNSQLPDNGTINPFSTSDLL